MKKGAGNNVTMVASCSADFGTRSTMVASSSSSSSPSFRHVSTSIVKPPPHPPTRLDLSLWDLSMFSVYYIQKGLLFSNHLAPAGLTIADVVRRLETSLSAALLHFYPLAGRFVTEEARDERGDVTGLYVYIDCAGQGAEFNHVIAEGITVADVLSPSTDVPSFVNSFFPYDRAVNYDGHVLPLLAVQLTELVDGFFLGCCFNHAVGDGTSYWMFFKTWSEITRAGGVAAELSHSPVHDRWFIDGAEQVPIKLPFTRPEEFVERLPLPLYRERMFHLSADSVTRLKARANREAGTTTISSLQSVSSLLWRCITRARRLPAEHITRCRIAAQNRSRLNPPLSPDYFGNTIYAIPATTTAGELLAHDLGWAAKLVHEVVKGHTDEAIRKAVAGWTAAPVVYTTNMFEPFCVMMGSSPRFDVYGCDFGWGRAVAARSGTAHKFDGKVTPYAGREGGGSMDLEICMEPSFMKALMEDEEFTSLVSPPQELQQQLEMEQAN